MIVASKDQGEVDNDYFLVCVWGGGGWGVGVKGRRAVANAYSEVLGSPVCSECTWKRTALALILKLVPFCLRLHV